MPSTALPPAAFTPPPDNRRFPLLDSMRGVAAGMIVLVHVAGTEFGLASHSKVYTYLMHFDVGVAVFFLISGFLLYRPFVAARVEGRPRIRPRQYARRRLLRIVPAFWVALTVLGVWPGLGGLWDQGSWRYYLFAQVYTPATALRALPSAWSLCVEITFYAALPFLALLLARFARGRSRKVALRRELIALAVLALTSVALQATLFSANSTFPSLTLPAFMDWFAYGMMLAVLSVAWSQQPGGSQLAGLLTRRPWLPWAAFVFVFWFLCTQLGLPRNPFAETPVGTAVVGHLLFAVCAVLLLLPALVGDSAGGFPRRLLARPSLAWFGLISYGIFLYHGPLIEPLRHAGADHWLPGSTIVSLAIVELVAASAAAALSYYLIEAPILRRKERGGLRTGP